MQINNFTSIRKTHLFTKQKHFGQLCLKFVCENIKTENTKVNIFATTPIYWIHVIHTKIAQRKAERRNGGGGEPRKNPKDPWGVR